jgi:hypothetical protein
MQRIRLAAAGGLLVLVAACSSSMNDTTGTTTLGTDAGITADMASVAADGFSEDVDVMAGMDGGIGNLGASLMAGANEMGQGGWRPGVSGCSFASGKFTCPDTLKNGLNVARTITFQDSSGTAETAYDSLLTASIHVLADISGDRTNGPWTATVARHRDFTFTGLLGTETSRTVNGTGSETVTRSRLTRNDSTRTYNITASSTVSGVTLPVKSNGANGYPTGGTITRTMTATIVTGPDSGRTVTRTVTITFDGTDHPSGQINGNGFTFDLPGRLATHH